MPSFEQTQFRRHGPPHQPGVAPGDTVRHSSGPSPRDWDHHRSTIEDLRSQGKTVKEVASIMLDSYGFKSNERMYKQRLKQWGAQPKYLKADEMFAAIDIIEHRRREGKATHVWIRGVMVDETRIQKFVRRNGRRPASATKSVNLPTIRYSTPEPVAVPIRTSLQPACAQTSEEPASSSETQTFRMHAVRYCHSTGRKRTPSDYETPAESQPSLACIDVSGQASATTFDTDQVMRPFSLSLGEDLLAYIQSYYRNTYFVSHCWSPWSSERFRKEPSPYPTTARPDIDTNGAVARPTTEDPSQIVGSIEIAVRLFAVGKAKEAGFLLNQACDKFQLLLKQQHPQFITTLLLLTTMLRQGSPPRLFEVLMLQLYNMAEQVLSSSHPIISVISALARLSASTDEIIDRAFNLIALEYCNFAGAFHPQYLETHNIHAWSFLRRHKLADASHHFTQLRSKYERLAGSLNLCTRKTLYGLAQVHIAQQDLPSAEAVLLEIQRRIEAAFGDDAIVELKVECLRLRATLYKRMAMGTETRALTLKAFEAGRQLLSPYHPTMLLLEQEVVGAIARAEMLDVDGE